MEGIRSEIVRENGGGGGGGYDDDDYNIILISILSSDRAVF